MVGQGQAGFANVDFAYTGPPVVVSNGQALDLVRQFGVQNAWYAYLKLRGMNLSKEEADKAVALKKFRSKIHHLKKSSEKLKDKTDDFAAFQAKEFSSFLEPNSLELKKKEDESSGDESDEKEDAAAQSENGSDNSVSIPTTSSLLEVIKASNPPTETTTQQSSSAGNTLGDNPSNKRHQETIDDVVSSIMDKIRNNLPFEGELSSSSSISIPPARTTKKGKGKKAKEDGGKQPSSDQVTILSNFSDIIRASTSKQPNAPQAKMVTQQGREIQQHHHQTLTQIPVATAHFPYGVPFANVNLANLAGQGITLPNNVTVQALLQSLQQQAKKAQQAPQETTLPDSSSQDIIFHQSQPNFGLMASPPPQHSAKKRQPAKKKAAEQPKKAAEKVEPVVPLVNEQPKQPVSSPVGKKSVKKGQKGPSKKPMKPDVEEVKVEQSREEDLKRIEELESQLSKCQKQLTAEKNKFNNQKKKIEKMQSELEKNSDAIQLVQIDLACQKTDNNILTAENIALKAENQQLKSKDSSKASSTKRKPKIVESSSKDFKPKGAKKRQASPSPMPVQKPIEHIPEVIEYGRRQSKRICVSRNRFLYPTYPNF